MTKEQRAAKWDAEFIPCKNHPERRCKRSRYIGRGQQCGLCANGATFAKRAVRWDAEFIPCKNHPNKRCERTRFITGWIVCSVCASRCPSEKKYRLSEKGIAVARKAAKTYSKTERGKEVRQFVNKIFRDSEKFKIWHAWYTEKKLHGDGREY